MSLPFTQSPAEPSLKDVLDQLRKDVMLALNCHHVGTVQSFNTANQTATVTINYKKTYYQLNQSTGLYTPRLVDYPIMVDCPCLVLGGGHGALTFPIQKGDECLVLFNDRDLDNWFQGSSVSGNATPRLHSFADGIILVGLRSLGNVLTDYDSERAVLRWQGTKVALNDKVEISNEAQNLRTLIQDLNSLVQVIAEIFITNAASVVAVTGAPGGPSPLNPSIVTDLNTLVSDAQNLDTAIGELLE